jgi:hypothetical protein
MLLQSGLLSRHIMLQTTTHNLVKRCIMIHRMQISSSLPFLQLKLRFAARREKNIGSHGGFKYCLMKMEKRRGKLALGLDLGLESLACLLSRGRLKGRNSIPPMNGCNAFGTATPSSS